MAMIGLGCDPEKEGKVIVTGTFMQNLR